MVTAISSLFSSTLDEGLKKLVQPVGLVPAALLLLLHLVITYPTLSTTEDPVVLGLESLDDLSKLALGLAVLLAVGYLIQAVSPSIKSVFTGEALGHQTWLASALRERQRHALERLCRRIGETTEDDPFHADLILEREARFPWKPGDEPGSLGRLSPTGFGNAWLAAAWTVWNAYGIDPTAMWTQMRTALKDDSDLLTAIDSEMASIDTLLNCSVVLLLFAATSAMEGARVGEFGLVPSSLIAVVGAYAIYLVATRRVRRWGDLTQAAFDLHRGKLATLLGLSTANSDVPRSTWEDASRRLAWGMGIADLGAGKDPLTVSSIKALAAVALSQRSVRSDVANGAVASVTINRTYLIGVAALEKATGGSFVTTDARVPRIADLIVDVRPSESANRLNTTVVQGGGGVPDVIEWLATDLAPGQELIAEVSVTRTLRVEVVEPAPTPRPDLQVARLSDASPNTYMIETAWARAATPGPTSITISDDGLRRGLPLVNWRPHHGDQLELEVQPVGAGVWRVTIPGDLPDARAGRLEITGADHD